MEYSNTLQNEMDFILCVFFLMEDLPFFHHKTTTITAPMNKIAHISHCDHYGAHSQLPSVGGTCSELPSVDATCS